MNKKENRYYVYFWYYNDNYHVFHIGKGTGNRCYETKAHRNQYFRNIINKYRDRVSVRICINGLTESEALSLERDLIKIYKSIGCCETNFHEGGCGGNTGNYNSIERSRKLSKAARNRTGSKNPMYGCHHSDETRQKLREANLGKKLSEEHKNKLKMANTGRKKTDKELEFISNLNKGKKMPEETYDKMMNSLCKFEYIVRVDNDTVYSCLGHSKLYTYCKNNFGISRTIVDSIVSKSWTPKFEKHMYLKNLEILKIERCID